MLTLRKEQIVAIENSRIDELATKISKFFTHRFPNADTDASLDREIRHQISKANFYGFRSERDIAFYVATAWLTGSDFDTKHTVARQVLEAKLSPEKRCNMLCKWLALHLLGGRD